MCPYGCFVFFALQKIHNDVIVLLTFDHRQLRDHALQYTHNYQSMVRLQKQYKRFIFSGFELFLEWKRTMLNYHFCILKCKERNKNEGIY